MKTVVTSRRCLHTAPALLWFLFVAGVVPVRGHAMGKLERSSWKKYLWADHDQKPARGLKQNDSALGGVLLGVLLWCIVPVCLWNNERIAIKQYKMQFKAEKWAIHVDNPTRKPLKEMDGRIVYLSGVSMCSEPLQDSQFPLVKAENKIKLRRVFQMFQWVEKKREAGEKENQRTVYYWEQAWSDEALDCPHDESGEHQNPPMPFASTRRQKPYRAFYDSRAGNGEDCAEASHENVCIGAYYLGEPVIRELLNWKEKEDVSVDMLKGSKHDSMSGEPVQKDGWWYWGEKSEEIGKLRVKFEELCPGPTSIAGVLAETNQGWTFVPIKRADSAGIGDNCLAEVCGNCPCVKVREALHYGEENDDEEFKANLESSPLELTKQEKAAFNRSQTADNIEEYAIEEDVADLCCVGPFSGAVISLMHWMGLEEEFLAVRERQLSLDKVMKSESSEAANRHHLARIAGFFLLVVGAYCIISPIIKLLNYNWITTLLGGGLISLVLCLGACLCSTSCFFLIVATAWIAHRPFLASLGILTAVAIGVSLYTFLYTEEKKAGSSPGIQAALLMARRSLRGFVAHF